MLFRGLIISALVMGTLQLIGCREADSISGTVTYNGEPVEKGSLAFQAADGATPGFGAQIVDGKYHIEKIYPGEKIVSVRGVKVQVIPPSSEAARRQFEAARAAGKAELAKINEPADYIPPDAEGNNQTVVITEGSQTLNFDLTGPPRK